MSGASDGAGPQKGSTVMSVDKVRRRALDNLPRRPLTPAGGGRSEVPCLDIYSHNRLSHTAFPYTRMVWVNYQPSRGIQVHFASHTVLVVGHDLGNTYKAIRERTLQQIGPGDAAAGPRTPGVEAVYIRQVSKNEPGFTWPSEAALEAEQSD